MTCTCGKPRKLSGRVALCAVCWRGKRRERAIETRIELAYRRARAEQRQQRRAA